MFCHSNCCWALPQTVAFLISLNFFSELENDFQTLLCELYCVLISEDPRCSPKAERLPGEWPAEAAACLTVAVERPDTG